MEYRDNIHQFPIQFPLVSETFIYSIYVYGICIRDYFRFSVTKVRNIFKINFLPVHGIVFS